MIKLGATGSVSSGAVIEAVRNNNPDAIAAVSRELEDSMMHRLVSQLATRRPKDHDGEPDMFTDYSGVHQFIGIEIERDGRRAIEWKPIGQVTLRELAAWLDADRKTSTTRRGRNPGMTKMLRDLSGVAKGAKDITVEAAMALRRARGGK